ncbi:MAG TPA: leucyl/phenylalanyl-tRNA--protein transferase [Phnomibacter sp.]|nr:leucyl/phenylalanyl-tRNA--protein transferase [Phnomibacter sp.]
MQYGPVFLNERIWFPPPEAADEDGLLAVGGDLSPDRLLFAYGQGIFPWYNGPIPLWWNPDPRLVLFPEKIRISKSMRQVMKRNIFSFTRNCQFRQVIQACGDTPRKGQDGDTWVTPELIEAYDTLHRSGHVHSFEAWDDEGLAGGLYGILLGQVFFGESMFARRSNASKAALIWAVEQMQHEGVKLIDCQVETPHLVTMGAELIPRAQFLEMVQAWGSGTADLKGQ